MQQELHEQQQHRQQQQQLQQQHSRNAAATTETAKASAIWLIRNKLGNAYMAAFCGK